MDPSEVAEGTGEEGGQLPPSGFELRLGEGRAFVGASGRPLTEGVVVRRFTMEIPEVRFPFDVTGGADRFRHQRCTLRDLELSVDSTALERWLPEVFDLARLGIDQLSIACRSSFLELSGRHVTAGAFTLKAAIEPDGPGIGVVLYELRFYRSSPLCAALLLHRLAAAACGALQSAGAARVRCDPLPPALRALLITRGFKLPDTRGLQLAGFEFHPGQLVVSFKPEGPSTPVAADHLSALEGARALRDVEELIGKGDLTGARTHLLSLSRVDAQHPFAAERLLQILAADPTSYDLALDLCEIGRQRGALTPAALWVEGCIRQAQGDGARSARVFCELAEWALSHRELFSAAAAARTGSELALAAGDDELASRALSLRQSAQPEDLEVLTSLAEVAERQGDTPAELSALRRIAAFGGDGPRTARAHARLGMIFLKQAEDLPRARLHLDQALRLDPADRESILALAGACERSGEHLRAVRMLDRAFELAMSQGETAEAGRLAGEIGRLWETRLDHAENALLRYREAASLLEKATGNAATDPGLTQRIARLHERLGHWTEALEAQWLLANRREPGRGRAEALLEIARILRSRLNDPTEAERTCLRALDEDPTFFEAAALLCELRRGGAPAPFCAALSAAADAASGAPRAAFLAERGEIESRVLLDPNSARRSFAAAVEADPTSRRSWLGLAAVADGIRDLPALLEALERLAELATPGDERLSILRRLADAYEESGDEIGASEALVRALQEPETDPELMSRLVGLYRKRGEYAEAADLCASLARLARSRGDEARLLVALLEETELLLQIPSGEFRAAERIQQALALAPRSIQVLQLAATCAERTGDAATARETLIQLLAIVGDDRAAQAAAYRRLSEAQLALESPAEAAEALEEAARREASSETLERLSEIYTRLRRPAEAIATQERLARLHEERGRWAAAASLWLALSEAYAAQGEPEAGLSALHRAASCGLQTPSTEGTALAAEAFRRRAEMLKALGDRAGSAEALERQAELMTEGRAKARALRAAAESQPDPERAERATRAAVDADETYPWGQAVLGLLELREGHPEAARQAFEEALLSATDSSDALSPQEALVCHAGAGAAARILGFRGIELVHLESLLEAAPEERAYLLRRCELLRELGSVPELIQALTALAAILPGPAAAEPLCELGLLRELADAPEQAGEAFLAALDRAPDHLEALRGALRCVPSAPADRRVSLLRRFLSLQRTGNAKLGPAERGYPYELAELLEGGDPAEALTAWEQAGESDPADPVPWMRRGALLEKTGRIRESAQAWLSAADRKRQRNEPSSDERLQAARLLLALGDPGAATAVIEATLREPPPEPAPFWLLLAEAHRKSGDAPAEAEALAHAAPLLPLRHRAPLWGRRAELLRDLGDRAGEREALSQAIVSAKRDEVLLQALRDACLALGDAEGACDALELALDAAGGDRSKVVARAMELGRLALTELNHPQRAEAAFRRALGQAPAERTALTQLASILLNRGEVREGLDLLRRDCDAEPDPARSAEQRLRLAELAWRAHRDPEIALAQVRLVLEADPESQAAIQLACELLYGAGASNEVLPLLRKLVSEPWEDQPEELERYLLWLADAEAATGDLAAARVSLERLMVERPNCATAVERWAELSREWPDGEAPRRLQEQSERLESHRGRALLLAEAAHRTAASDAPAGAELLRRALAYDPRPDLSDALQRLLEASGDRTGLADELVRAAEGLEGAARVSLLVRRARLLEEAGVSEATRMAWEAVAEAGPWGEGYIEALHHRLDWALEQHEPQRAVDSLVALAEQAPDPVHRAALLQRAAAISSEAVGDSPRAIELLRAAAEASGSARAHALLAEGYRQLRRWEEAVAEFEQELSLLAPGEERQARQRRLGLLLWQELHQPERALPYLLAGLEGAAAEAVELEALASCAAAVGDLGQELAALERIKGRTATGRFPPDREERRIQLLEEQGRIEDATAAWRSLLLQDPLSAAPFRGLRRALEAQHAWRALAALFQERADALEIAGEDGVDERAALLCDLAALLAGELHDLGDAERVYRQALAVLPGYRQALAALRALREAAGDADEAAALLAAEIDAGAPPAQLAALTLRLGKLRLQLDQRDQALESFERAARIAEEAERPGLQAEAWVGAGSVLLSLGRAPEAWTHANDALPLATPEVAAEAQAVCAEAAFQTGSAIEAREHWRELLRARPSDPRALRGLDAVARLGEPTLEAELLLRRTRGDADPTERAQAWKGLAELRLGPLEDPIGGEHALHEALRLDPGDPQPFERLCRLLESQDRFHELAASLHDRAQLVASVPEQSALFREEGELLRTRLADPRRAAEVYARALELDPSDASAVEGLAESLLTLGKLERAGDCYRRALELGGGQLGKFFLLYRLGDLERRAGRNAEALDLFRRSSESNPSFLPAREGAADLAAALGQPDQELEALAGLLGALDPTQFPDQHAGALLRIAEIERRAQHFDEARSALARAAELTPGNPGPLERMASLSQEVGQWPEALASLTRLAEFQKLGERAATLRLAADIAVERLGDGDRAMHLLDLALAEDPSDLRPMQRLAEIAAARGLHERLAQLAERVGLDPAPGWLEPLLPAVGRAFLSLGRDEDAYRMLSLARMRTPEDRELLEELANLADRLGRLGEAVDLEEAHAESLAGSVPLEASSRLRTLARRSLEQLEDPARAERLLDRAAKLAPARPEDRRLLADLKRNHAGQELNALTLYLDLVRENPLGDLALLRACGTTAADLGAQELSQVALGLASALEGAPPPTPAPPLLTLPRQAWSQSFLAVGPLEQLLQELAPYLEPLFPASLTRYAVGDADRVGPHHAPQLHEWVERVRAALRARPATVYLSVGFPSMAIESTRPPSLIVGGVALAALGSGPMQFLLAQRLALLELGFALPSKFSPKDITTLARLAVRFITGEPGGDAAEEQRLIPFLEALERGCPAQIRVQLEEVAGRATRELAAFDPRRHALAVVARANRMALWITGDLAGALAALEFMERGGADAGTKPWHYPQGRALIDWAFSQEFLDLRKSLPPGSE